MSSQCRAAGGSSQEQFVAFCSVAGLADADKHAIAEFAGVGLHRRDSCMRQGRGFAASVGASSPPAPHQEKELGALPALPCL